MNKIIGTCNGAEIDVKRFYVPGVQIESQCPKCESTRTRNLADFYLSFPVVGKPSDFHFYCEESNTGEFCNTEWDVKIILDMNVRIVE